jgi:transposase
MILELFRQGLSVSAIARQVGRNRRTVKRCLARGVDLPAYAARPPIARLIDPYAAYLRDRLAAVPALSARRLAREIRALGYVGGETVVKDAVRGLRPPKPQVFEVRFETAPGRQAQVDFARFTTGFAAEPGVTRIVWLFSMVLGHSRFLWARFTLQQDLQTVLRMHMAAFAAVGGAPQEVLYDRMKTAVVNEDDTGAIIYNRGLVDLARHYGFSPRACRAYRAKTKGKVERPFRYIREDFFLGRSFQDLDDLNAQLGAWLDEVANVRVHGTTKRIVAEAFAAEKPTLTPLPAMPYSAVLKLERRVSRDGMISIGGNFYSVPDTARRRVLDVHAYADTIQIFEAGALIAIHPVLEGRNRSIILAGHRRMPAPGTGRRWRGLESLALGRAGEQVALRPLDFYDAVGRRLSRTGGRS